MIHLLLALLALGLSLPGANCDVVASGTLAPGVQTVVYGISSSSSNVSSPTFLITLSSNETADLDLYCSGSTSGVPSETSSEFASVTPGGSDEVVYIPSGSPYYPAEDDEYDGARSVSCAVVSAELSGPSASWTLTVQLRENDTELASAQQDAALALFDACCGGADAETTTGSEAPCAPWRLRAEEVNLTSGEVLTDLCLLDGAECGEGGDLIRLDLAGYGLACDFPASSVASFTSLVSLDLSGNSLNGTTADGALLALSEAGLPLERAVLSSNPWSAGGLPADGGACALASAGLVQLGLTEANLTGPVPACLQSAASAPSLEVLTLAGNSLNGSLASASPSTAPPYWQVDVSSNSLVGTIPATLLAAPALRTLVVASNALNGTLPVPTGSRFSKLGAASNAFSGPIPDSVAGSSSLSYLDATGNELSSLPSAWLEDESDAEATYPLSYLRISNNAIEGSFPVALASYTSLSYLSLQGNKLTGSLPNVTGGFTRLYRLYAGDNQLNGSIPSGLGDAGIFSIEPASITDTSTWNVFSLPNNQLSGDLPAFLEASSLPTYVITSLQNNSFDNACDAEFQNVGGVCSSKSSQAPSPSSDSPAVAPSPVDSASTDGSSPDPTSLSPSPSVASPPPPPSAATWGNDDLSSGQRVAVAIGALLILASLVLCTVVLLRHSRRRAATAAGAAAGGPGGSAAPPGPAFGIGGNGPPAGPGRFERFHDSSQHPAETEMASAGGWGAPSGIATGVPERPGASGGWPGVAAPPQAAAGSAGGWGSTADPPPPALAGRWGATPATAPAAAPPPAAHDAEWGADGQAAQGGWGATFRDEPVDDEARPGAAPVEQQQQQQQQQQRGDKWSREELSW